MSDNGKNETNGEERFKILDFDGKPMPAARAEEVKKEAPRPPAEQPEIPDDGIPKQITSIEELNPELKNTMKELFKTIPKEEVKQLLNEVHSQKEVLFDKENKSAFGKLNDKDQNILIEKMAEWNVPEELSNLNASVILSWLENTIKESKK
jgi:hypothetical protein